jgi:hypothetical protein
MGFRLEGRTVLITGASDGIGRAIAEQLDGRAARLILAARGREALEALSRRLATPSRVIPCDLSREEGPAELLAAVADERIDLLVNNAGVGVGGAFSRQPLDPLVSMVRLNVEAPLRLLHGLLPAWIARREGAVLNVGSLAGFVGCPGQGVYGATKSFLNYWSEALAAELAGSGVQVTLLAPGSTRTGFFSRAGIDPTRLHKRYQSADAVARAGLRAVERGTVQRVPGASNLAMYLAMKVAPRALVRRAARGLLRPLIEGE